MSTGARSILALLLVGAVDVRGFHMPGAASSLVAARRLPRPALRTPAAPAMSLHSPTELVSSLVSLAADVSDDFDVNSLPPVAQNLLASPWILAVPITLGSTVAAAIIAFLLYSMGAF